MNKIKYLVLILVVCLGFSSCLVVAGGPGYGRGYGRGYGYHARSRTYQGHGHYHHGGGRHPDVHQSPGRARGGRGRY